jgi:hypothetical protein
MARVVAVSAVALVAAASFGIYLARSSSAPPAAARYGQLPSWLPKAKIPVGRVVTATAAHPWLAIQGDTVSVHLAHARVLVTTVGPVVPEEGEFPVPKTSPCAFTVTFTKASGRIPLSTKAFTILDELSILHRPVVTAQGGGPPPRWVLPGQTVTLTVRDILPTGGGRLRWAPEGTMPIVSWDFDVEID